MTEINWNKFGDIIKFKRKENGWSQSVLAELVQTSQPVISLVERGSPIGINDDKIDLLKLHLNITDDLIPRREKPVVSNNRTKIFISYSHADRKYYDRLIVHLKPLEKKGIIEAWSDTRISAGQVWKDEIRSALNSAQAAVLLISADFLASEFIVENEVPPLLEKAETEGATIIPVILKPCRFVREPTLSKFQAVNSPEEPLIAASEHESELIYDAVAQKIEDLL